MVACRVTAGVVRSTFGPVSGNGAWRRSAPPARWTRHVPAALVLLRACRSSRRPPRWSAACGSRSWLSASRRPGMPGRLSAPTPRRHDGTPSGSSCGSVPASGAGRSDGAAGRRRPVPRSAARSQGRPPNEAPGGRLVGAPGLFARGGCGQAAEADPQTRKSARGPTRRCGLVSRGRKADFRSPFARRQGRRKRRPAVPGRTCCRGPLARRVREPVAAHQRRQGSPSSDSSSRTGTTPGAWSSASFSLACSSSMAVIETSASLNCLSSHQRRRVQWMQRW